MQRSGGGLHRGGMNPQQGMGIIPTLFGIHQGKAILLGQISFVLLASPRPSCIHTTARKPLGLYIVPSIAFPINAGTVVRMDLIRVSAYVQGKEGSQSLSQQNSSTRWALES